jgi:hypothetical protein
MDDLISRQAAISAVNTALFPKVNTAKDAEKALRALPSAQPDLSGYSDRLWETAYNRGYERCRQDAIDALAKFVPYAICDESTESYTNGLTDAYNLILQLPSAQPEINTDWDVISRHEAIDAIEILLEQSEDDEHDKTWNNAIRGSINAVKHHVPSAQADSKELSFTHKALDCISRQAAIDALDKEYRCTDKSDDWDGLKTAMLIIENLPPAQPEKTHLSEEDATSDCISRQAVEHLDWFTKLYCRDKSITDDLAFRCEQCEFEMPDGRCLVKVMARKLCPNYKDFGAMGDL